MIVDPLNNLIIIRDLKCSNKLYITYIMYPYIRLTIIKIKATRGAFEKNKFIMENEIHIKLFFHVCLETK